jgi:YesN/AraC family two-component response regulator
VHQGIEEVHKSFDEAELAMKHKYLLEDADYIDYKDVRNREFIYSSYMESNLSRSIIGFINGKTQEPAAEDFVEETMQLCHIDVDTAMDNVECFKYEMVSIINKAFMICGVSEGRKERIQQLVMQPTLEKFRKDLADLLHLLRELKQNGSKQDLICQRAAEYIAENYRNPQLSVTQLGEELKLSPYYASKLFKEKYEMSMPDYVAKTRVQKAKEQLRNTELSIKEIAEQNGFLSSNVFIRTFKKWEGVTPGIYREDGKKWQQ